MNYLDGPRPRIFGHRGANAHCPENTLESFRRALRDGADYLEMDVHCTRDGAVVVMHDPLLDRTTDGSGPVAEHSLAEVRRLDAGWQFTDAHGAQPFRGIGVRVPTLGQVLGALPDARCNIDLKSDDPRLVEGVLAALDRYNARDRVLLTSEDATVLDAVRARARDVATGFSPRDVMEFLGRMSDARYTPPGVALQVPVSADGLRLVSAETVSAAHALGVEVHVWTVNDPDEMRELAALGVDGWITDDPALAWAVRASHQPARTAARRAVASS